MTTRRGGTGPRDDPPSAGSSPRPPASRRRHARTALLLLPPAALALSRLRSSYSGGPMMPPQVVPPGGGQKAAKRPTRFSKDLPPPGRLPAIVPPFDKMHDFSIGPRPRRYETGASRSELRDYDVDGLQEEGAAGGEERRRPPLFAGVVQCSRRTDKFYAAAWLSTVETFLTNPHFQRGGVHHPNPNMEFGTFAALVGRTPHKVVDMFDFFVHHLSNYDKLARYTGMGQLVQQEGRDDVVRTLNDMERGYVERGYHNPTGRRNGNTVAIMPFYASSRGSSRSGLDLRMKFLNLTVKTVSHVFPNVVVCVCTRQDFHYVTNQSGLNRHLYDVLLLEHLNKSSHLPLHTSLQSWIRVHDKIWDGGFEWIYYTETDQIPHLRDVDRLLHLTLEDEGAVVVPHRGQPYPTREDFDDGASSTSTSASSPSSPALHRYAGYFRNMSAKTLHTIPDLRSWRCCFDRRTVCSKDANNSLWHRFDGPDVHLFRQHESWAHVAGTGNLRKERYQVCSVAMADNQSSCD